jgi:hypothetical protein
MEIFLMGMKDPTTLWTLPIIGSAGKTSPIDTHDEQDAFDNLRDEFMERANAACSTTTSSLAKQRNTQRQVDGLRVAFCLDQFYSGATRCR